VARRASDAGRLRLTAHLREDRWSAAARMVRGAGRRPSIRPTRSCLRRRGPSTDRPRPRPRGECFRGGVRRASTCLRTGSKLPAPRSVVAVKVANRRDADGLPDTCSKPRTMDTVKQPAQRAMILRRRRRAERHDDERNSVPCDLGVSQPHQHGQAAYVVLAAPAGPVRTDRLNPPFGLDGRSDEPADVPAPTINVRVRCPFFQPRCSIERNTIYRCTEKGGIGQLRMPSRHRARREQGQSRIPQWRRAPS
jgi:hypothetical protein